ncbi:MAG: N-acetylmuramoyl-L-alanine amidase [Paludibacteraceae bacterium]|nr:N-acetylmuramoyl-L-alanine amidase [Paludibacteraceae bacterium]
MKRYILSLVLGTWSLCTFPQSGFQELADSLTAYTGFSTLWAPAVRVKQMRVNGNKVTLHTNLTLRDYRWTPENIAEVKHKVSLWTLGHENGKVTIYSGRTDIETLITDCARQEAKRATVKCQKTSGRCDLTDRHIALYPSHGLYFNRDRNEWIWQRATLWTTVEDLYSQEYVRLIKQMLENAGATVIMPRAGLDNSETGESGMPRWAEGARYWLKANEADSALWDLYKGDEYKDDMKCRAMWLNAQTDPIDLCLALHTDGLDSGDDSTIVGTLAIYTAHDDDGHTALRNGQDREKTNRNLADWVQTQVTNDLRSIAPEWTRRQLKEANYCESRVPVMPSIILELLSHKNMADMRYGLDPKFRFAAARAVYKGILRYLNGINAAVQPLPVQDLGIGSDRVLRWIVPVDSLEPNAAPSYYMVYMQEDGGEWDVQQVENDTHLAVTLKPGVQYNYYVVAGNDGGLSFPSPVISAYINDQMVNDKMVNDQMVNDQMVNVIDAFNDTYGPEWFADSTYAGIVPGTYACEDHFTCAYIGAQWDYRRASQWINDDNCGWGACYRDHAGQLTMGNTRDWSVLHGRILRQMGISYVSCTAGMVGEVRIQNSEFSLVDYVCGRQREPLTDANRQWLGEYLTQGGKLLLSTDHFSAIDAQWAKRHLHASYYAAKATRSGRIVRPNHRPYRLLMEPNETQLFTCTPEALRPEDANAARYASYEDMRCPAAVSSPNTLVYGFPLESVIDFDKIYRQSIEFLLK